MGKVINGFGRKQRQGPAKEEDGAFVTRLVTDEFAEVAADLADDVSLLCARGLEARHGKADADERIAVVISRLQQAVDGSPVSEALVAVESFRYMLATMCLAGGVAAMVDSPPLQAGDDA